MSGPELRRVLAYIAPYRGRLALVLFLTLLATGLSLIIPYLSRILIDQALLGRSPSVLYRVVAGFVGITLVLFGINVASGLLYTRTSADILFDMRLAVFRHLQRLSPSFFVRMPLGQIVSRINADVSELQRVVSDAALSWISHLLVLVGTITMLVVLDVRLFVVSLVTLPPALFVLVRYRSRLEASVANLRERSAAIGSFLIESLRGMRVIVASNAEAREIERFTRKNDSFIDGLMRMRAITYVAGGLPGVLVSVSTGVVFLYGGSRVIEGSLTLGTMAAFLAYQARLLGPVQGLMGLYTSLATARVSLARVHEILDEPIEVADPPVPIPLASAAGAVTLEHVHAAYDRGPALEDVSFSIEAGATVAIVGASGAGKTSLTSLLLRHADPDQGVVTFDGHDVRMLSLRDVREHIVAVEQDPFVFHASIAENLRVVRPSVTDDEVEKAIHLAALDDFVSGLPDGLDTVVGESGYALSAGQRQRLALARVYVQNPRVVILDEFTSSLDRASQDDVLERLGPIMAGRTMILVSHRREVVAMADRVIALENGRVVADGPTDKLLHQPGPVTAVVGG